MKYKAKDLQGIEIEGYDYQIVGLEYFIVRKVGSGEMRTRIDPNSLEKVEDIDN